MSLPSPHPEVLDPLSRPPAEDAPSRRKAALWKIGGADAAL